MCIEKFVIFDNNFIIVFLFSSLFFFDKNFIPEKTKKPEKKQ